MSTIGFIEMDKPTMIPQAVTEKIDNDPIAIAQAAKSRVYVVWYEPYDDDYLNDARYTIREFDLY